MKTIYDSNGTLINIGDWDYKITTDLEGNEVICNPLPAGTVEKDEEVASGPYGLYVVQPQ